MARLRNISPEHDPVKDVPLKAIFPLTLLAAFYCFARAYILIEDVIALRSLPPIAYDTFPLVQISTAFLMGLPCPLQLMKVEWKQV